MGVLSLFFLSVLALASAGEDASLATPITKEYQKCLRIHSKGKLDTVSVRYGEDLFKSSLEKCAAKLPKPSAGESPVNMMHRTTQTYIATLRVLNSFKRPPKEEYKAPDFVSAPASPPQDPQLGPKKLDGFTQRDFSVLYTPWLYCLGSQMKNKETLEPEKFIKNSREQCEIVELLADGEALTLLDSVGGYGNIESQQQVLSDFKILGLQMVVIGALRADGKSLGTALQRSEQVDQ